MDLITCCTSILLIDPQDQKETLMVQVDESLHPKSSIPSSTANSALVVPQFQHLELSSTPPFLSIHMQPEKRSFEKKKI